MSLVGVLDPPRLHCPLWTHSVVKAVTVDGDAYLQARWHTATPFSLSQGRRAVSSVPCIPAQAAAWEDSEVLGQTGGWGSVCCVSLVHLVYKDTLLQKEEKFSEHKEKYFLRKDFFFNLKNRKTLKKTKLLSNCYRFSHIHTPETKC